MTNLPDYAVIAFFVFLAAGIIKGTVGIGLPTAAIGLMSQFIDPRLAISLVVFPLLTTNLWQMLRSGHIIATLERYWLFAVLLMGFLGITAFFANAIPTTLLVLLLGSVVVLFAATNLFITPPSLPDKYDRLGQIVGGISAGLIGGFTAIWGPPMVLYFLARRTKKEEFVRISGTLLFLGSLPLCIGYWQAGLLNGPTALMSAFLIIPSLIGFTIGEQLRKRLNADRFRTALLLVFLFMGLNLIRRALF